MTSLTVPSPAACPTGRPLGSGAEPQTRDRLSRYDCALPHHVSAAAVARHAAKPVLVSWGLDGDTVYDALLVISELVTNAVEHALPSIALHLEAATAPGGHTSVCIDVTDGGPAPVPGPWIASCAADEHGRGQQVVTALAQRAGIHHSPHATDHWAALEAA
ncbi:ATP-binding protein [Streptomyces sp. NPDC048419]|uniref:ATP-binding protein n=1 Tax=Streptomyces sp. NPDC048419 TaxID=3365547 RepID=UPI003711D6AD